MPKVKAKEPAKSKIVKKGSPQITILLAVMGVILVLLCVVLSLELVFIDKIFPGIFINEVNVVSQSPSQASETLHKTLSTRLKNKLTFEYQGQIIYLDLSAFSNDSHIIQIFDIPGSVEEAYNLGRQRLYLPPTKINIPLKDEAMLKSAIKLMANQINEPAINAQIKIEGDLVNVTPSQEGKVVNEAIVLSRVRNYLNTGILASNDIPISISKPTLTYDNALFIKKILDQVKLAPVTLSYDQKSYLINRETLLPLIDLATQPSEANFKTSQDEFSIETNNLTSQDENTPTLILNPDKTQEYFKKLAQDIDREVEEPLFELDPESEINAKSGTGQIRVKEFRAPKEGLKLNLEKSKQALIEGLINNTPQVSLVVDKIPTKNKLANELGIRELIGQGHSNFAGSIANRIYNVGLAASRINGVMIAPGETFSFVNTVGDISAATGYKQAYVIKSGRTVLDDGGGVCQVSTTLFRAVLNSGLPIINRVAHAYRVSYYEQGSPPGIDATIFHPTVDFKFKNDTNSHILIRAYAVDTSLSVELYGTSDGRIAKLTTPRVSNITPAPPELRQDDPTLPKGQVKQVDWAAAGATVEFGRTVTRNGETIISESFKSNYKPWQAVYLVGTKEG